jgi:hypothetical protein
MAARSSPTVAKFLAQVPVGQRRELERVQGVIQRFLPPGYEEAISKSMLVYQVPLTRYSDTYNGHPLWYLALAAGKSYCSLHLMSIYSDPVQAQRLKDGFRAAGTKLDMGKACIRFKRADDLPLDVIGAIVASTPVERWVQIAQAARRR